VRISQKLVIILLLIGLLPAAGVSLIAVGTIRSESRESTQTQLQSVAVRQEQRINVLLREKLEEVSKLTNQLNVREALATYMETEDAAVQQELTTLLFDKRVTFPDIQQLYIARSNGEVIAATLPELVGQERTETSGMTVQRDDRDDVDKLYITLPLSLNRETVAMTTAVFRMDDLTAVVQDYTGLGETGETLLVNRNDPQAISLFPLRSAMMGALSQSLTSYNFGEHIGQTYSGQGYDGERALVSVRLLNTPNWLLAVSIDESEAYASSNQLHNTLMVVMTGTFVVIILLALAMTRSITAPILKIVRTSQAIGEGDLTAKSDVVRKDEIGTLSDSINKMGASLRSYVDRIRGQRSRLETVLNTATESILAIDTNGTVVMANKSAAELSEREVSKIVDRPIAETFQWLRGGHEAAVEYAPSETRTYTDLEYKSPSGDIHYVKLIVSPVHSESSQLVSAIVTIHDETKGRELENMKIDFVSMAAHELRTPLAALRGYLELAVYKTKESTNQELDGLMAKALKSTADLNGLISNLLDVSRIERGALVLDMHTVDLATIIQQAIEDAQVLARDKKIALAYDGPQADCTMRGDEMALHEVVTNLLSNAIKYTSEGGSVTVRLQKHEDTYSVNVEDTGIGIPKRALPHLFTKFYRVHGGLDSGSTGTGLGLFITKSIVERHGGTITVSSAEGKGSTFTFTLPVRYEQKGGPATKQEEVPKQSRRQHHGWFTKNIDR
jgi:two-component system phosphate regulon sensor histidine kinase PhoR